MVLPYQALSDTITLLRNELFVNIERSYSMFDVTSFVLKTALAAKFLYSPTVDVLRVNVLPNSLILLSPPHN